MKKLNDWIHTLLGGLNSHNTYLAVALLLLIALLSSFLYTKRKNRKIRRLEQQVDLTMRLMRQLNPAHGLEQNLDELLVILNSVFLAPSYAFYLYDERNETYVMRAVRYGTAEVGPIRPSYSGLSPFTRETYFPPMSFESPVLEDGLHFEEEGEVPLLVAVLPGGRAIIRMGPVKSAKDDAKKAILQVTEHMHLVLDYLLESDRLRNQSQVVVSSGRAFQKISSLAVNPTTTLKVMMESSMHAVQAAGCFFLQRKSSGHIEIPVFLGDDVDFERLVNEDKETQQLLRQYVSKLPFKILAQGDPEFYRLPPYFAAVGGQAFTIVRVDANGLMVFWYESDDISDETGRFGVGKLRLIAQRIAKIITYQPPLQHLSEVYTDVLKQLAYTMDNLVPHTVGYSDLMARYSIVIARELGLEDEEIHDIALAAQLSNIGVLGLSGEFLQKGDRYSDAEYEMMKLHSEVGASIVSAATGNENAASYILYHHERVDGNGYPAGLKGREIPMGARIVAVVQTFLAKINGRQFRDPLRFDQAIETLRAAAGTQLDADVVEALIRWYEKKQADPQVVGKSLGTCWEMNCSPSIVCQNCPAYGRTDVNCWEVEGNHCKAHGKQCETCFVRTEYMTRALMQKAR